MPLLRQWSPVPQSLAAVWQIDEPAEGELFFSLPQIPATERPRLPRRRLEFLAGRYLLWHLENNFPLHQIAKDAHGKPRLPGGEFYFSISHSYPFVAVLISPDKNCGIDIQRWHPRIQLLADKFLSREEKALFQHDDRLLTMAWCIKEAAYKWNGKRGLDFIRDIQIQDIIENEGMFETPTLLYPDIAVTQLHILSNLSDGHALSLVCK